MIVCHCNVLSSDVLRDAAKQALKNHPEGKVTPNVVFEVCRKHVRCGCCLPLVVEVIADVSINNR